MSTEVAAPRGVRIAGAIVGLQGLAGLGYAVTLVLHGLNAGPQPYNPFGTAAYFGLLSAGVLAAGIGLLRSRRWARTPAVMVQLILLGVAWYAFGPSHQQTAGGALAVLCVAILVMLFTAEARAWAMGVGRYDRGEPEQPGELDGSDRP